MLIKDCVLETLIKYTIVERRALISSILQSIYVRVAGLGMSIMCSPEMMPFSLKAYRFFVFLRLRVHSNWLTPPGHPGKNK